MSGSHPERKCTTSRITPAMRKVSSSFECWICSYFIYRFLFLRDYAISGGLWGGTSQLIPDIRQLLEKAGQDLDMYVGDMFFLAREIYPKFLNEGEVLVHASYGCMADSREQFLPFPFRRDRKFEHVGQVFDENDQWRQKDIDILKQRPATMECRKYPHWTYG